MYFDLVDEVADALGTFALQTFFGEENVSLEETVRIYDEGVERAMPFPLAFKKCFL